MPAVHCPNLEINEQMCPCLETSCPRHGICCECVAYHSKSSAWPLTACMRGTQAPSLLASLPKEHSEKCSQYEKNQERCICSSENCSRLGTCCDCVRHHWLGGGRVSCLRGSA